MTKRSKALRARAEELLNQRGKNSQIVLTDGVNKLVHQLQVHQIELEIQNEELRATQANLEELRSKYFDLYDLAPVGYFTIDKNGLILEANLTGADLLGVERKRLIKNALIRFVARDFRDQFYRHRKEVLQLRGVQTCVLKFRKKDGTQFHAQVESVAVEDDKGLFNHQRTVVVDINERKEAEENIRRLSQEVLRAQEVAHQKIASDLHDHLAQNLSGLKIGLDKLFSDELTIPDEIKHRVSNQSQLVEQMIESVRQMAYDLHPASLEDLGLVSTVRQYCEDFGERNGLESHFFSAGLDQEQLDFDTKIALYRLVQEALENIKKHAAASQFTVRMSKPPGYIRLSIEDNGKGFDVAKRLPQAFRERRMGLWGMKQRVAYLRGEFEINSLPQEGTRVLIKIPYVEKTSD